MTSRPTTRRPADRVGRSALTAVTVLAAAVGLVAVACGGDASTPAPTPEPTPTVTDAPLPGFTDGFPSFALPSFEGDPELEALIPTEIGGETMFVLSMTGDEFLGGGLADELQDALTALGKGPSDLSVAFGGTSVVSIIAFRVDGVPGGVLLQAVFEATGTVATEVTDVSIGGKAVKRVAVDDADEDVNYLYAANDVVFTVGGEDVSDALLVEVFTKLP